MRVFGAIIHWPFRYTLHRMRSFWRSVTFIHIISFKTKLNNRVLFRFLISCVSADMCGMVLARSVTWPYDIHYTFRIVCHGPSIVSDQGIPRFAVCCLFYCTNEFDYMSIINEWQSSEWFLLKLAHSWHTSSICAAVLCCDVSDTLFFFFRICSCYLQSYL